MKKKGIRIFKYLMCFFALLTVVLLLFYYIPFPASYLADKAGEHADYYFEDEEKWIKSHGLLEVAYYKLWELKTRKELIDNVHGRMEAQTTLPLIQFAAKEVRDASLTQYQAEIPAVFGSSISCLIRGFGFCDQVNSGLALLLQDKLEQAYLYNIYTDSNCHTLLKTQSDLGTVWVDAYGCVNVFGFPDELTTEGKQQLGLPPAPKKFVFPEKSYKEGVFFNAFTFSHSLTKAKDRFKNLLISKMYNPDQVVVLERNEEGLSKEIRTIQFNRMNAIQTDNMETKKAYITARIYHLCGEPEQALAHYKIVKEKTVNGLLGKYADSFIRRLERTEVLCQ